MDVQNKQTVILDLRKNSIVGMPSYIQEDSNVIEFTILDNGANADLTNVGNIVVNYKRPDKAVISRLLTVEGNKVTYTIGSEEMKVPGYGELEIQFYSADNLKRISTKRFKTYIAQQIGNGDILEGDSQLTLLQELFVEVDTTKQGMIEAEAEREQNEAIRQSQEQDRQTNTVAAIESIESAVKSATTNWLNPVADFNAISTAYPNPNLGDTVQCLNNGYVYRFDGVGWVFKEGYASTTLADLSMQLAQNVKKTFNSVSVLEYENLVANIGTETEDWTPAFQAAVDWLASKGGGDLIIPYGTYKLYTANPTILAPKRVLITSDNIRIKGLGKPIIEMNGLTKAYLDSIDDYSSSGRDVFTVFSFVGAENCSIENIAFNGTWDGTGTFRFASPRAKAVGFLGAKNCFASNLYGFGILGNLINATNSMVSYEGFYQEATGIKVTNCHAVQCLENGANYMGGTENCTFNNNIMENNGAAGFEAGTTNVTIVGNVCVKNKQAGITVAGTDILIEGNECNENGSDTDNSYGLGISVTGAASYLAGRIKIKNNGISQNKGFGIQIYPGAFDIDISGNQIIDNCVKNVAAYNYGIYMVGTSALKIKDIKIDSNIIKDSIGNMISAIVVGYTEKAQIFNNVLKVHDSKSTNVYIQGTSKYVDVYLNSMNKVVSIESAALMCNFFNNVGEYYYRKTLEGSAIPNKGTWEKGDTMKNISPTESGTAGSMYIVDGWRCKQSGTFGTLSSTTGSISNGQTTLTVNDASPFAVGQYIIIAGVTGAKKITAIDGLSVTIGVAANADATDAPISFSAPLFFEMRSLTGN